jgi:hypothetical protein
VRIVELPDAFEESMRGSVEVRRQARDFLAQLLYVCHDEHYTYVWYKKQEKSREKPTISSV